MIIFIQEYKTLLQFLFWLYNDPGNVHCLFNINNNVGACMLNIQYQLYMIHFKSLLTKPLYRFGSFSGPYNPYRFKDYLVPKSYPTNKEIYDVVRNQDKIVLPPVRNMRHVNPVRQSGPLPSYSGSYTMEDIKKVFDQTSFPKDFHYCQMDVDEVMRRVPGITRKEVEHIVKLGFSPLEQVDYAYLVYNLGLDVFYFPNQVYIARQVVTNSKGQKVQVYWNSFCWEDMATLNVGFAPVLEPMDYHWQIFLWADPAIKVTGDLDLGVPNTWFQYEQELSTQMVIAQDQVNIPEDIRPFNTPRNPFARSELWKSQEQLALEKQMQDPNWKLPTV